MIRNVRYAGPLFLMTATLRRVVVVVSISIASGCGMAGWAGYVMTGGEKPVEVDAQYTGLDNRTVAVVVTVDAHTRYRHPDAPLLLTRAVGGQMSAHLASTTFIDPGQIAQFQKDHPYWHTLPYGDLFDHLPADRLIVIDLYEYDPHDPDNRHLWRGQMSANIGVVERDSANPDAFVYHNTVHAQYPAHPVPLLKSDEQTIELGMRDRFARLVVRLFYDHKEKQK